MPLMRSTLSHWAPLGLLLLACSTSGGGSLKSVAKSTDASDATALDPGPAPADTGTVAQPEVGKPGSNQLTAVPGPGMACNPACLAAVAQGAIVTFTVKYARPDGTSNGAPIADALVSFTSSHAGMKLSAGSVPTGPEGKATVSVTVGTDADTPASITASVADDPDAGAVSLRLEPQVAKKPALVVTPKYQGKANVTAFTVRAYLEEGGKPLCSDLHPDALGPKAAPVASAGPAALGQTATIATLPVPEGGTARFVVQIVAPPDGKAPLAHGCKAGVEIVKGQTTEVTVTAADLPWQYEGDYLLETTMDLHSGLSGTAGDGVKLLIDLFAEPGQTAVLAACKNASGVLSTVCPFLVSGGQLTSTGIAVASAADSAFYALVGATLGSGTIDVGKTISGLLSNLRFQSTLSLSSEPGAVDGTLAKFAPGTANEKWDTLRFPWKFGQSCAPDDDTCGFQVVKLGDVFGASLEATLDAGVDAEDRLAIAQHPVSGFRYGTLLDFLIEKRVLPLLFNDPVEQLPTIDSFEKIIATLFGDKYCLKYNDCCAYFESKIQNSVPAYVLLVAEPACELAIPAAASWIRGKLTELTGELVIGTAAPGCPARLVDDDRKVDAFGKKTEPCAWDASFDFSGEPFLPKATFVGERK